MPRRSPAFTAVAAPVSDCASRKIRGWWVYTNGMWRWGWMAVQAVQQHYNLRFPPHPTEIAAAAAAAAAADTTATDVDDEPEEDDVQAEDNQQTDALVDAALHHLPVTRAQARKNGGADLDLSSHGISFDDESDASASGDEAAAKEDVNGTGRNGNDSDDGDNDSTAANSKQTPQTNTAAAKKRAAFQPMRLRDGRAIPPRVQNVSAQEFSDFSDGEDWSDDGHSTSQPTAHDSTEREAKSSFSEAASASCALTAKVAIGGRALRNAANATNIQTRAKKQISPAAADMKSTGSDRPKRARKTPPTAAAPATRKAAGPKPVKQRGNKAGDDDASVISPPLLSAPVMDPHILITPPPNADLMPLPAFALSALPPLPALLPSPAPAVAPIDHPSNAAAAKAVKAAADATAAAAAAAAKRKVVSPAGQQQPKQKKKKANANNQKSPSALSIRKMMCEDDENENMTDPSTLHPQSPSGIACSRVSDCRGL